VALTLKRKGFREVRPLKQGFNALIGIGYPMELKPPTAQ